MEKVDRLNDYIKKVKQCSDSVESFLDGSQQMVDSIIENTKGLADFTKHTRNRPRTSHVGHNSSLLGEKEKEICELHVKGFDSEQIWQGIEMSNEPILEVLTSKIDLFGKNWTAFSFLKKKSDAENSQTSQTGLGKKKCLNPKQQEKKKDKSCKEANSALKVEDKLNERSDLDESVLEGSEDEYDGDESMLKSRKIPVKKSVVDDAFFVLEDMNRYLESEDKREMRDYDKNESDSDDIDYFAEDGGESDEESSDDGLSKALESAAKSAGRPSNFGKGDTDARMMMYSDFFDEPDISNRMRKKLSGKQSISKDKHALTSEEIRNVEGDVDGNDDEAIEDENIEEDDDVMEDSDIDDVDSIDGEGDDQDGEYLSSEADETQKENLPGNVEKKLDDKSNIKSKFERENSKMQETIKAIESENLAQKPWQLVGEATAAKRPKNSLLEENLSFDQTLVTAPTVTEETTETLEQMIVQRIKDQAWDDVVRKAKPVEKPFEYKKSLNLDQEKSKLSLAEVYEKEYIKQTEDTKEEETNPDHEKIQNMMGKLFAKLDALSNFQFTPKQPKPELKVVSNLPSLEMEEQTPITVSTETMLAPEEIYDKKAKELKGQGEKTLTDRKGERREKKARKREIRKNKERKLKEKEMKNPGKVVKESKRAALEKIKKNKRMTKIVENNDGLVKNVKSSTAFFTQLQENIGKQIRKEHDKTVKRKKDNSQKGETYKL